MPNCKAGELGLLSAKPHSLIKSASLTMALYFLFSILFMGNAWAQAKKVTGTVTDGENAHVFAFMDLAVIQIPEFGTLFFRIPLSEFIPY